MFVQPLIIVQTNQSDYLRPDGKTRNEIEFPFDSETELLQRCPMTDHLYKKIERGGSSRESNPASTQNAVAKAAESVRNGRWLEVDENRGPIIDGKVDHWQFGLKIGFTLEDRASSETLEKSTTGLNTPSIRWTIPYP